MLREVPEFSFLFVLLNVCFKTCLLGEKLPRLISFGILCQSKPEVFCVIHEAVFNAVYYMDSKSEATQTKNSRKTVEVSYKQLVRTCLAQINSQQLYIRLDGVKNLRELLSTEQSPPSDLVDVIVRSGLIRPLVRFLGEDVEETLQLESAWVLGNIAAGNATQTLAVVSEGAVKPLINLLSSPHLPVIHQSLWALGNIAAENSQFRDVAFENGLLSPLLGFFEPNMPKILLRTASWVLVNLCRSGQNDLDKQTVRIILPKIFFLISSKDHLVRSDGVWCLAFLSDCSEEKIELLMQDETISFLEEFTVTGNQKYLFGIVHFIHNLASVSDKYRNTVFATGCVEKILTLLKSKNIPLCQEILSCTVELIHGSADNIQRLLDTDGFVKDVRQHLKSDHIGIRQEALWVVNNIAQSGTRDQIHRLLEGNILEPLCDLLTSKDSNVTRTALETISDIVKFSPNGISIRLNLESSAKLELIENLQNHGNQAIHELACQVVDMLTNEEDLDESFLIRDAALHKFAIPVSRNAD